MIISALLGNKTTKTIILFLGIILIAAFWYVEKTKLISQYGVIFHEMGMRCNNECGQDRKLQYFQEAIRHDPNLSDAHYQLALIYDGMGDYSKSLKFFRKVTELDHRYRLAFYKVGVQHFREGAYELAFRYLLRTNISGRSYIKDAPYYLARLYDRKGEYVDALRHYYNGVLLAPRYAGVVFPRMVEIYHMLDQDYNSLKDVTSLRKQDKHDLADLLEQSFKAFHIFNYKVGEEYFKKGEHENALKHFLESHRYVGKYSDNMTYYLGRIHDQKGEYVEALRHYYNGVLLAPRYAGEVFPRMVEIYHMLDQDYNSLKDVTSLRKQDRHDLADQLEASFEAVRASEGPD